MNDLADEAFGNITKPVYTAGTRNTDKNKSREELVMTNEQMKALTAIMENKDALEELFKIASVWEKAKGLEIGDRITIAGISWSKFAEDEEGNSYMLADEAVYEMNFGDTNDWRESGIRKKLNDELYEKIVDEIGADSVVPADTDLFSHDGLRDYGICRDMVSLLTYDLYRNNRENISGIDKAWWLSTPDSTPSGCGASCVRYVSSNGDVNYGNCGWDDGGVRPFFILKS